MRCSKEIDRGKTNKTTGNHHQPLRNNNSDFLEDMKSSEKTPLRRGKIRDCAEKDKE